MGGHDRQAGGPAPGRFLKSKGPVTIEGLKTALPAQDYETLTVGDDRNALHCLLAAKLRAKADIQSTGSVYDESVPEVRLALMKLWLYELFAFVGEGEKAGEAYEDYTLIIKTAFGEIHVKGEGADLGAPALACVKPAMKKALYGREGC